MTLQMQRARYAFWLFATLCASLCTACSNSDEAAACNCPNDAFGVTVPADRAGDVKSVTATGVCLVSSFDSSNILIGVSGSGSCHITVTFKSGAPEFDANVQIEPATDACACRQVPSSPVVIPELDGGGSIADGGEAGSQ
jgi:hypothetical protein